MGVQFLLEGMTEFQRALKALPTDMALRARLLIGQSSTEAEREISIAYSSHRHSGNLAEHLYSKTQLAGVQVEGLVRNNAFHAWLFENGTEGVRRTDKGVSRGRMPPAHIFIPIMIRKRREMYNGLKAIIAEAGLQVSGDAD